MLLIVGDGLFPLFLISSADNALKENAKENIKGREQTPFGSD